MKHLNLTSKTTAQKRLSRIIWEYQEIGNMIEKENVSNLKLLDFNQLQLGIFQMHGPDGSPYEGYWIRVQIEYPEEFPFKFPKFLFLDKIWHPLINPDTGALSTQLIDGNATPAFSTIGYLFTLLGILEERNLLQYSECFINKQAAEQINLDLKIFQQHSKSRCQRLNLKYEKFNANNQIPLRSNKLENINKREGDIQKIQYVGQKESYQRVINRNHKANPDQKPLQLGQIKLQKPEQKSLDLQKEGDNIISTQKVSYKDQGKKKVKKQKSIRKTQKQQKDKNYIKKIKNRIQ